MAAPPEIATAIIRNRTRSVCDLLQKVTASKITANGVDYIHGAARLHPRGEVIVIDHNGDERTLRAKVILIATGSRPARPNISFDIPGVCDTDTI
jgi:NAD(P) transhydrogenase